MNLADMTQESIGGFAEELGKIEIKQIEIPKFSIPNWPKDIVARGLLGKRNYCVPALGNNNLPEWRTGRHKISFHINNKGAIKFDFHGLFGRPVFDRKFGFDSYDIVVGWASSDYEKNLSRLAALILFDRFKIEIFAKILAELKNTVPVHNQVVDAVTKVFELFIPFLVADQLSS